MSKKREQAKQAIREFINLEVSRGEIGIAFTEAARWGIIDFIEEQLAKGTSVDIKAPHGGTALSFACSGGMIDIVDLLISKGADVNVQDDLQEMSPLITCVAADHKEDIYLSICKKLIDAGANLSLKDKNGLTAFDWARDRKSKTLREILKNNNS